MPARRLAPDPAGIAAAAAILRSGGLVAFPTETVYGLGAHALNPLAVRRIFEAKERPADDPLIVHLHAARCVMQIAQPDQRAERLAERFWPGPLTLVLPKRDVVPREVTAGLGSVAVRVPSHPIAAAILREAAIPVAAPSANLFGRPSPTRAEHVLADLDGRIDAVLDGGPAEVGVESTIVDLTTPQPRLLRAGGLPAERVEEVIGTELAIVLPARQGAQLAPGMLASHYAPRTPLVLVVGPEARARLLDEVRSHTRVGVLALEEDVADLPNGVCVELVGSWSDPDRSARQLFNALRTLDLAGCDVLLARELADPQRGLGRALADRLRRAAQRVVDSQS
jgi:L-threonylcarbamoyladenylate synthase